MASPTILKLCTGRIREATYGRRTTRTGIDKRPVAEAFLGPTGLSGDEVAEATQHGGPHQAVLLYASEHYPEWVGEFNLPEPWPPGSFGENLHLQGLTESGACLGDVWAVGESAVLAFSIPREPCYKLAGHLKRPEIVKQVWTSGRAGWYARVKQVGPVREGDELRLLARPYPEWDFAHVMRILSDPIGHRVALGELADVPAWTPEWQARLTKMAGR